MYLYKTTEKIQKRRSKNYHDQKKTYVKNYYQPFNSYFSTYMQGVVTALIT